MDDTAMPVPVATHSFRQQYLFAFAPQVEVIHHIRTQTLDEEASRLSEILAHWQSLQPRVEQLMQDEAGYADTLVAAPLSEPNAERAQVYASDALFQKSFSSLPVSFAMVEVDKLVAPQRTVNLDYVDNLVASLPQQIEMDWLLDFCVAPKRAMEPIQHLEVAPNTHIFSSPNSDIRFLGAFFKHVTDGDLTYAVAGGLPAAAVIAFVGYGCPSINVIQVGTRYALNNGFHRVYALRARGVSHIPVVIQYVRNPQLECPPQIAGLPREYIFGMPRPVLVKDFFEPEFAITLKARERVKMVTVGIALGQHDVPA